MTSEKISSLPVVETSLPSYKIELRDFEGEEVSLIENKVLFDLPYEEIRGNSGILLQIVADKYLPRMLGVETNTDFFRFMQFLVEREIDLYVIKSYAKAQGTDEPEKHSLLLVNQTEEKTVFGFFDHSVNHFLFAVNDGPLQVDSLLPKENRASLYGVAVNFLRILS